MATQAVISEKRANFDNVIRQWDRRIRVRDRLIWFPRALMMGLLLSIIFAAIAKLTYNLPDGETLFAGLVIVVASLMTMLLTINLRRRDAIETARAIDLEFMTKERLSTAIELIEGRISGHPQIASYQIDDAAEKAREIDPGKGIELKSNWREWMLAISLFFVFLIIIALPDPNSAAANPAQTAAIGAADDTLRDITEVVASDSTLDSSERENLLETLETSLDTLNEDNVSPEKAFAAMQDVASALREQANSLRNDLQSQQQALDATSDALDETFGDEAQDEPGAEGQEEDSIGTLDDILKQAQDKLETLEQNELLNAADALAEAAEAAEAADPELANALEQAAEALRNEDLEAAQEALERAQQNLQDMQQQQQQQQQSAQQMQQLSEDAELAAEDIAQSQQSGQSQQNQEQSEQNTDDNTPGDRPGNQGQPQNNASDQSQLVQGEVDAPSQRVDIDGPEQGQPSSNTEQSGTGDTPSEGKDEAAAFEESGEPVDTDSDADGQGVNQYQEIYAPQRIGEQPSNAQDIILEPDPSDIPAVETDQQNENMTGNSTVPYNQVFSSYQNAANSAIESGIVPPSRRDVVRDYFTSLQPDQ